MLFEGTGGTIMAAAAGIEKDDGSYQVMMPVPISSYVGAGLASVPANAQVFSSGFFPTSASLIDGYDTLAPGSCLGFSMFSGNGAASRMARHRLRETAWSIAPTSPKVFIAPFRTPLRCATDGATPSSRSSVRACVASA